MFTRILGMAVGYGLENDIRDAYVFLMQTYQPGDNVYLFGLRITPAFELRFEPGIEAEYLFEAYCINFTKDNPGTTDRLTPKGPAADEIKKILALKSDNLMAVQLAIWAITDNVSPHDANEKFDATTADINAARRLMEAAGLPANRFQLFTLAPPQ